MHLVGDTDHCLRMLREYARYFRHLFKTVSPKLKNDDFVAMEYRCNVNTALEEGNKDNQQELPNDRWKRFRDTVTAVASTTLGKPTGTQPRKPWISQEMIDKMEERRQ